MMGKTTDRAVGVKVAGVRDLLKVLSKMPKDLQNNVRDASTLIAQDLVDGATQAASTPLQQLAASGLKVKRDRIPMVRVGSQVLKPGTRASDVFYGAEFGGRARPTTQQFLEHRGTRGYFFYPTARANAARHYTMWTDAVDKAMASWDHQEPK